MANINLLPWREERREQLKREFLSFLGLAAVVAIAVMFAVDLAIGKQIDDQDGRNSYLNSEIVILKDKIKQIEDLGKEEKRLENHIDLIKRLQTGRPYIVKLFDEIVRVVPSGIYLESITRKDTQLEITGKAEATTRISEMLRNMEKSEVDGVKMFKNPSTPSIKKDEDVAMPVKSFTITAMVASSTGKEEGDE